MIKSLEIENFKSIKHLKLDSSLFLNLDRYINIK